MDGIDVIAPEGGVTDEATPVSPESPESIAPLVEQIRDIATVPCDAWAVSALLESIGLRDVDARKRFGRSDIFELGRDVFALARVPSTPPERTEPFVSKTPTALAAMAAGFFVRGLFFAAPMAGQIICVLVLRYSLWAYLEFDEREASVVGIGTVSSFIVTGLFVMSIGRQGAFYKGQLNFVLLQQTIWRLVWAGLVFSVVFALSLALSPTVLPILDGQWALLGAAYALMLSILWLNLAVLYFLELHVLTLVATLVGVAVVGLCLEGLGLSIYAAHLLGIGTAAGCAFAVSVVKLRRMKATSDKKHAHSVASPFHHQYIILRPFIMYGTFYFGMLFIDRLVAWTATANDKPFLVWFNTPYELGMDWALLSLIITIALLDFSVHEFARRMVPVQKSIRSEEKQRFNTYFKSFVVVHTAQILIGGTVSIVVVYFAVSGLRAYEHIPEVADFFGSPITENVYWYAAAAYLVLSTALLLGLLHFTIGISYPIVRSLRLAMLVNIGVGFIASRAWGPEFAVVGLLVGTVAYSLLVARASWRHLKELDYHYYAAF